MAEAAPPVLSVGELDRRLKRLVEGHTADVNVEGEISGLKEVASGHAYFTLKDEREEAAIECVMYRTAPARATRLLEDGARVVVVGRATVYAPRGKLQLIGGHGAARGARGAARGARAAQGEARGRGALRRRAQARRCPPSRASSAWSPAATARPCTTS